MIVSKVEINWFEGFANDPQLVIYVDEMKSYTELVYEQRGPLYFAVDEESGQVDFFAYSKPGNGYGGHTFVLKMVDGSTQMLHGPWSSRSSVMNAEGFPHSTECTYVVNGKGRMAGHILVDRAFQLINIFDLDVEILPTVDCCGTEVTYRIVKTEAVA